MIETTENSDIRKMTTFGLPAECGRLIVYDNVNDLAEMKRSGMLANGFFCLGGGSNLLFTTGRYDGTVIHHRKPAETYTVRSTDARFTIIDTPAGTILDDLCRDLAAVYLWGTENLSGIPGAIGGAAVQNAGAYGAEMKDVVERVTCFDVETAETRVFSREECSFGYRDSVFKQPDIRKRFIITGVTLKLSNLPSPNFSYAALAKAFDTVAADEITPRLIREAVIAMRDSKLPDPRSTGSAGSFFRNPVVSTGTLEDVNSRWSSMCEANGLPMTSMPFFPAGDGAFKLSAAWLIDRAGGKKLTSGGAAVWPTQPLVIVNATGTATGNDVVTLEKEIQSAVRRTFGVDLHPEVIHV